MIDDKITDRDLRILQMRTGIRRSLRADRGRGRCMTYAEIGKELGLSGNRVRSLAWRAMTRIQWDFTEGHDWRNG